VLNLGLEFYLLLEWTSILLIQIAQELNHGINLFVNPKIEVEIIKKSCSLGRQVYFCFFVFLKSWQISWTLNLNFYFSYPVVKLNAYTHLNFILWYITFLKQILLHLQWLNHVNMLVHGFIYCNPLYKLVEGLNVFLKRN